MQFAFIAPPKFTDISGQGDFELVLAQHLDDPDYVKRLKGRRVYLDNGAHEGAYKGLDWLFEKIDLIKPELVFAPDDVTCGYKSMLETKAFLCAIGQRYGEFDIPFIVAAIPHGDTLDAYRVNFHGLLMDPRVDWIGISYLDPPKFFPKKSMAGARRALLQILGASLDKKPCHLLGISDGFEDIRYARTTDWVKSCDSSSAFMCGYLEQRYDGMTIKGGKIQTLDPSIDDLLSAQKECIAHNIDFIKNKTSW